MRKLAIILATAAVLGPGAMAALAQGYYYAAPPTWLDRLFGSAPYQNYYYDNPAYYEHHGRGWYKHHGCWSDNGWHNGWRNRHWEHEEHEHGDNDD